ncbi:BrnT family toxin [Noviherbaspirillum saxi]|uniref:BrnT family toxin n=1 Tax=Noviherbaspirillum saxi TaxID=2320863 RepID=A0A3A3GA72_9BURK|nr:BrnT family toxin [Noviherbaspirillum saxi]RJF99055.1 BrnT family toxin [Noviherbaspirillum saxi]
MDITFDPAKNKINEAKHGVSLELAESIEWDTLYATVDERQNYGEVRIIGLAYIGDRLYCVVFVDRGEVRRIISLRKANSREVKRYAEA